jgi:DNA (cytosine-5)-methyltransferase 1
MTANGGGCLFASEWDRHSALTYEAWHGKENLNTDDIRLIDHNVEIPDHDVLTAGFPCQPFSLAGVSKKNSMGREHGFRDANQGNLFIVIADIARIKRPPVMLLENVKNLKSHDKGNTWSVIMETLESLDYAVHWKVIDAINWVPQHRERVFIVCLDKRRFYEGEIDGFSFPQNPQDRPLLESILEKDPDPQYMLSDRLWAYLQGYAEKHRLAGNGFGYQLVDGTKTSRTLSARYHKDGSEVLIAQDGWRNPRKLSVNEARLLMGYSPKYEKFLKPGHSFTQVVSNTQAYKQFGNSVVPQVIEAIGKEIERVLALLKARNG